MLVALRTNQTEDFYERCVWHSHRDKTTTWMDPIMLTMQQQVPDRAASPSDDLPPGWEVRFTEAGEIYYVEYAATQTTLSKAATRYSY